MCASVEVKNFGGKIGPSCTMEEMSKENLTERRKNSPPSTHLYWMTQ